MGENVILSFHFSFSLTVRVLLHGFPQSWYERRHIMPSLAKNYIDIVPDLRGVGDLQNL